MGTQVPSDLPQLWDNIRARLTGCGRSHQYAAEDIIVRLRSIWEERAVETSTAETLQRALGPRFDTILAATNSDAAAAAVDDLVAAWETIANKLDL